MSFITEVLMIVASYVGVFVLTLLAVNFLLGGLFGPYIKVRGSRGKLVLVKVKHIVRDYFVTGKVEETFLVFKDRKKETRRINLVDKTCIYRSMAVSCIDVDDEKNTIITYSNTHAPGFDAVKFEDLHVRALMKPALIDNNQLIMIILLVVIMLVSFGILAKLFSVAKLLKALTIVADQTIQPLGA